LSTVTSYDTKENVPSLSTGKQEKEGSEIEF
jgi:hypothetical protein